MEDKTDKAKGFFLFFHTQESKLKLVIFFFQHKKTVKPYLNFSPEISDIFRKYTKFYPFDWKMHIRYQQLLSAPYAITVKVHRAFCVVVKKMWNLHDGAKSHYTTTLLHKRPLDGIPRNGKPLRLCCHSLNNVGLGLLRLLAWARMTEHREWEVSSVAWLCSRAA